MYRGIRLSAIGVALSALAALYGCSGSGGDGTPSNPPSDPPSAGTAPGGRLSMDEDVQPTRVAAAQAIPGGSGSVTQSSHVDVDSTTLDTVNVELTEDADGNLHVRVTYNGDEAVDTENEDAEARNYVEHVHGEDPGTRFFERLDEDEFKGVEFYRSLDDGDVSDLPAGDLWVDVYTNFGVGDVDDDYLAGGIWVFIPEDGEADGYEFGAFADGGDPFTQANIAGLEGDATYSDSATGVYSHGTIGGPVNEFFDAVVTLMANFGDDSNLGMIGGTVDHFRVDGEGLPGGPVLTLMTTEIGDANSGFHTGDTSMSYNNEAFTGTWGGQFYNNGAAPEDNPGAVAGTFGAANSNGDASFVGVYGAHHQPPTTN